MTDNAPPTRTAYTPKKRSAFRRSIGRVFRIHVFPVLLSGLVRMYGRSLRFDIRQFDQLENHRESSQTQGQGGLIFALWHGPHFPVLYAGRDRGLYVVASRSADGEMLARVLERFGYRTVRGSSGRGGTRALIDLARHVNAGDDAVLAVDGPRGPIYQVKPGIILLAKLTGAPIIPITGSLARYKEFKSWDRFRLPYPFTRAIVASGKPMFVPSDADDAMIEAKRVELENMLNQEQAQLDAELQPSLSTGS